MALYIECENDVCGHKNYHYQQRPVCEECGESLEGITPLEDTMDSMHANIKQDVPGKKDNSKGECSEGGTKKPQRYRLCPNLTCRHPNTHSGMDCEKCKGSLDGMIWQTEEAVSSGSAIEGDSVEQKEANKTINLLRIKLVSKIDGREVEIPAAGGVIGRAGDIMPQYFLSIDPQNFISGKHAQIKLKGTQYVLIDTSHNGTELNRQLLEKMREYVLAIGDIITLADKVFEIRALN